MFICDFLSYLIYQYPQKCKIKQYNSCRNERSFRIFNSLLHSFIDNMFQQIYMTDVTFNNNKQLSSSLQNIISVCLLFDSYITYSRIPRSVFSAAFIHFFEWIKNYTLYYSMLLCVVFRALVIFRNVFILHHFQLPQRHQRIHIFPHSSARIKYLN